MRGFVCSLGKPHCAAFAVETPASQSHCGVKITAVYRVSQLAPLTEYGFQRVQGSLYVTEDENMAKLFVAIETLKSLPWFPPSVRDIRAFRIEQWSDFTSVVKGAKRC